MHLGIPRNERPRASNKRMIAHLGRQPSRRTEQDTTGSWGETTLVALGASQSEVQKRRAHMLRGKFQSDNTKGGGRLCNDAAIRV